MMAISNRDPDALEAGRQELADQPILRLQALSKTFGSMQILKGIDLEIRKGEFLTLLGPSGCGKTTTLRIVAGLEHQSFGSVFLNGSCIDNLPAYRRDVHTVFQSYALFPHLNVFQNIAFPLELKRTPPGAMRERVQSVLALVGLDGFEARHPHELSGGQQQRVALARAVVDHPAILLLDEPFGALDLKLRKEMQTEVRRIHRESGLTFIHVTHDQEEAMTMSDRIVVMAGGEIQQIGSPQEVYSRPQNEFVANFVGKSNFIPVVVLDITEQGAVVALPNDHRTECARWVDMPASSSAALVVRPENLKIATIDEALTIPSLAGSVADVILAGPYMEVVVQLPSGEHLSSFHVTSDLLRRQSVRVGERVQVAWNQEDAFILPIGG
jgi:spermidine/putrescine transport system ATP-binding protein